MSAPPHYLDVTQPIGVLTYLPNPTGEAACQAGTGPAVCSRPAHWILVGWEDVPGPAGDVVIARVLLCGQHLSAAIADIERLPGTDPTERFLGNLPGPATSKASMPR